MDILKSKRGQSLVEFTVILPILLLLLMGIAQFAMILSSYITIENAAREGARAGIVGTSYSEIENLIIDSSKGLEKENFVIKITPSEGNRKSGDTLTVKITYNYKLTVPIINHILKDIIPLKSETSMRIE